MWLLWILCIIQQKRFLAFRIRSLLMSMSVLVSVCSVFGFRFRYRFRPNRNFGISITDKIQISGDHYLLIAIMSQFIIFFKDNFYHNFWNKSWGYLKLDKKMLLGTRLVIALLKPEDKGLHFIQIFGRNKLLNTF